MVANKTSGMDAEGVYRKSGGSGQVHAVRQGFEKDQDFDISDPELDIHAVASTLKQYFRRLPTPLISYNIYDQLLDAGREFTLAFEEVSRSNITSQAWRIRRSEFKSCAWPLTNFHALTATRSSSSSFT